MDYSEADIERIVNEVYTAVEQGNYRKATKLETMEIRLAALAAIVKNIQAEVHEMVRNERENAALLADILDESPLDMLVSKIRKNFVRFKEVGLVFTRSSRNTQINDKINNISLGIGIVLENDDKTMLIEAATNLTIEDITDHIERMEKMRTYANLHGKKRTFLGAAAGVVIPDEVREYALKQGFYVIEPSGETFNIISPTGNPKEW